MFKIFLDLIQTEIIYIRLQTKFRNASNNQGNIPDNGRPTVGQVHRVWITDGADIVCRHHVILSVQNQLPVQQMSYRINNYNKTLFKHRQIRDCCSVHGCVGPTYIKMKLILYFDFIKKKRQ